MALTDYKKRASSAVTEKSPVNNEKSLSNDKVNLTHNGKKRNWATVVYPESAPENWIETLKISGAQVAISPLHDRDLEADEKTPKKAHWHVMMVYPGPKSLASVKAFCSTFGGIQPVPLEAVRGYYRYLTHQDNPEKFQYDEKDIQCLNGFSILDFIELTRTEIIKIKKELLVLINTENFFEYADFIDYLQDKGTDEFLDVGMSNTYFFDKYLTSRRHKAVPIGKVSGSISGLVKEANS